MLQYKAKKNRHSRECLLNVFYSFLQGKCLGFNKFDLINETSNYIMNVYGYKSPDKEKTG